MWALAPLLLALGAPTSPPAASPPAVAAPAPAAAPIWRRPNRDELRRVVGIRYLKDLSRFEMLAVHAQQWGRCYISKDGARLYVPDRWRTLRAFELSTGALLWERRGVGNVGPSMFEQGGRLWVGAGSELIALSPATGEQKQQLPLDGWVGASPTISGSLAILPLRPNSFVAVDLDTHKERWRVTRATPELLTVKGQARATVDEARGLAYLGFSDGMLMAVSLANGQTQWMAPLGRRRAFFPDVDAQPLLIDGLLLAASYNHGLFWLDPKTGEVKQRQDVLHITHLLEAGPDLLIAATGDGEVVGLTRGGQPRWRYRMEQGYAHRPELLGEYVVFGSAGGPLTVLEQKTGRPLQLINPGSGFSTSPAVRGEDLAVLTNEATLLVLKKGAGGYASP